MGSASSSLSYYRVPNAIIAFGPSTDSRTLEKLDATMRELTEILAEINTSMNQGYLDFLSPSKAFLECVSKCFLVMNKLIVDSDELLKSLEKLEPEANDISALLEKKLNGLKNHSDTLRDINILRGEKIAELVTAVNQFNELLPIFTKESSILNQKCFLGAQVFVPICGIFKLIVVIAEDTKGYYNPGLASLKEKYMKTLASFQVRCIRSRLQSIHLIMNGGPTYRREYMEEDLTQISPYFDIKFEKEEFNVSCGRSQSIFLEEMPMLVDSWDPREKPEINFESVTLNKDKCAVLAPANLWKKALHIYRMNVKEVMEQYFAVVTL